MRNILDLGSLWNGMPLGAPVAGNKAPVAIDDTRSILQDSGPVSYAVLANDFDPEGQPLTLVSATAALGTAVAEADNTVTYTPPPGISGSDTVVYEIADDLDQRRTAQINIAILEPDLAVSTLSDNTLAVTAKTGSIDVTVTEPAVFAGTFQFDTADLAAGPVNGVLPAISGTAEVGQSLGAVSGLWMIATEAAPATQGWQWLRDGTDISGAISSSYVVQAADEGSDITLRETQSDSGGQREVISAPVTVAGFTPTNDTDLIAWHDAAETGTITGAGGVSAWADKVGGGSALVQSVGGQQPTTGSRSQNGLNVLDFDGSDFLERAITLPASGDVAIHMALIIDAASNPYEAVVAFEATNDMQIDANSSTQFDGRLNVNGIGSSVNLTGGPFSGALILSVIFDLSGSGQAEIFIGGISRGSMAYTAALDTVATLHVMTNRSKNAEIDGAICELAITGNTENRAKYHGYLSDKWGIV